MRFTVLTAHVGITSYSIKKTNEQGYIRCQQVYIALLLRMCH